jgi:hypothetical protein
MIYTTVKSRGRSVSIMVRLRYGRPEFDSQQEHGYYFFATESRPVLELTQPLIQGVRGSSPGGKASGA